MITKRWLALAVLLISLVFCAACEPEAGEPEPVFNLNSELAVYLRTWPLSGASSQYWNAGMIQGQYLTDLIIAFASINPEDGSSLFIETLKDGNFANLWDEVAALKAK
jgi:hypothetical protein